MFITPPSLIKGDEIAVIAPSGEVDKDLVLKNLRIIETWGLKPILGKNIFNKLGPFAGTDNDRLFDLQKTLNNTSIKAILCARGGYGVVRILDQIDFTQFVKNPKWVVGFSDITALHCHINKQCNIETIHGPMVVNLSSSSPQSVELLKNILFKNELSYHVLPHKLNKPGKCSGTIVGGNLTTLLSLVGSKSVPDLKESILFIEDIGEYLYHLDRIIYTLKRAGWFNQIKGLLVGNFSNMKEGRVPINKSANQIISDALKEYSFPICHNFPSGHINNNMPLIFGRKMDLCINPDSKTVLLN